MLHAGVGPTHVNALLSSMNIPPIARNTLKRREREVGPAVEKVAKRSCTDAFSEEREKSGGENITTSYDMGWQKRGRGYNSLTGVGHMIGLKSRKVVGYKTRNKRCSICHFATLRRKRPRRHDCRRNWSQSSKAMEPDAAVAIAMDISDSGGSIASIIGDNDSTTIKKLREEVDHDIEKQADIVHTKRSLNNSLHEMKKANKELTEQVIAHICKCFAYAVTQNSGDVNNMKKAIAAIVPHCFGEHNQCGDWCGYHQNPDTYTHRGIKGDLQSKKTMEALQKLMKLYIDNTHKYAAANNSQANESLNNTIASKAPKARHYGSSESNDFRVAAAVCQKNLGRAYVSHALKEVSISPGDFAILCAKKEDKATKMNIARNSEREGKLRRIQLRQQRASKSSSLEIREGVTYCKNVDFVQQEDIDSESIPPPTSKPVLVPIQMNDQDGSENLVIFDLETTCTGNIQKKKNHHTLEEH